MVNMPIIANIVFHNCQFITPVKSKSLWESTIPVDLMTFTDFSVYSKLLLSQALISPSTFLSQKM